jgi:hypothetical protein
VPKRNNRAAGVPATPSSVARSTLAPRYSQRSAQFLVALCESATATLDPPTATVEEDTADASTTSTVVAAANRTAVRETASVVTGSANTQGHMRIRLIQAGWSLNGVYYSAEVLKRDGAKAWPAGKTLCYVDHATDAEDEERPAGSIKNLAAVLTTDAEWNDGTQSLEADARVFSLWREPLAEMAPYIGMSIRAWVYAEQGEADGKAGLVVNSIAEGRSVDFVTVPAAGGAILSVGESVLSRPVGESATIGAWLESRLHLALTTYADDMYGDGRLTRDERITLSNAIGDGLQAWTAKVEAEAPQLFNRERWAYPEPAATPTEEARRVAEASVEQTRTALQDEISETWGGDGIYTWVRDFDPDAGTVWFDTCPHDGDSTTWQQQYTTDDQGAVTLDGDRVEVIPRVVYDPAPAEDEPGSDSGDVTAESLNSPTATPADGNTTDGEPPAVPTPNEMEGPDMSGTQAGAPPVQAGTAPVVDTPTTPATEAESNRAVIAAMEALTRQVTTLTEANAALAVRVEQRDTADRIDRNRTAAREAVAAALNAPEVPSDLRAQIAPRVTAAVLTDVPTTETGDVDLARLGEAVTAAITAESGYAAGLLESAGVGRPRGLGSQPVQPQTSTEFEAALAEGFVALGMNPEAAKIAAHGRG